MDATVVVAIVAALLLLALGVARLRVRLGRIEDRVGDLEEHDELRSTRRPDQEAWRSQVM